MYDPKIDTDDLFVTNDPAWQVESSGSAVYGLDYNQDGSLVAYSNSPGEIIVASSYDGEIKRRLSTGVANHPITGLKFHPSEETMLLSTTRDGQILLFNIQKNEISARQRHLGSSLLALSVDSFGEVFSIACADGSLRIYDMESMQRTKALIKLTAKTSSTQAINIYGMIFHPEDSNVILAAGWNDRVIFWDIRTGNPERTITGTHVRGPAVDIHNDVILTGSAREKKQLELWDYGSAKKIKNLNVDANLAGGNVFINTAKISRNGMNVVAGGSGPNVVQAYEYQHGKCFGQAQFSNPVSIVQASPFGSSFIAATETGEVACYMIRLKST